MRSLPPAPWGKPWFHQKYLGVGAGLPCSWEGWVVIVGSIVALSGWAAFADAHLQGGHGSIVGWGVAVALVPPFIVTAWGRTSGGWRRRVRPRLTGEPSVASFSSAPWGKPWFHSKPGGYGSGLPCSWEGWATYGLFLVCIVGWGIASQSNDWLPGGHNSPLGWGVTIVLAIALGVVVRNRTVGGWRAGTDGE